MSCFINRNRDIANLDEEIRASRLVVVTGRRRVGKTALIREWARRGGVTAYSQAIEKASIPQQIEQIWADIKASLPIDIAPKSWEDLLKLISLPRDRLLIVLDEFPYLVASDPSLPSRLQKWLDHHCPPNITLCLTGSSQSMMQELFLDERSALFGRARRILTIRPLAYRHFCEALQLAPHDLASFVRYSLVGGIPKYWQAFEQKWQPLDAAMHLFFGENAFFDNEMLRLTSDENISSASSFAALEAIGRGAHKPSEIAGRLGIKQTSLNKVLTSLVASHVVKREIPFGESERTSKRSLYRIIDPFVLFHYGVYSPHRSRWSIYEPATQQKLLNDHASLVFEETYRALFPSASRYFEGASLEIDCVRYSSEDTITVSEVKFRSISEQEKMHLEEQLRQKIARSRLANLSNDHTIKYDVVDWTRGIDEILRQQRD